MAMLPDRQLLLFLIASIKPRCLKYLEPYTKPCLSQHCCLGFGSCFIFGTLVSVWHSSSFWPVKLSEDRLWSKPEDDLIRFSLKWKTGKVKCLLFSLSVQGQRWKLCLGLCPQIHSPWQSCLIVAFSWVHVEMGICVGNSESPWERMNGFTF